MTIGIVLHPYGEKKPSGLGHYILELSQHLLTVDQENTYLIYTKGTPKITPELPGHNWRIVPLPFGKLWRDLGFVFAPKADVYLFGTPVLPVFFKLKKTIVVTHDFPYHHIRGDTMGQTISKPFLNFIHKRSLKSADSIVAISKYTKQEDITLFKADEHKIRVIYNGFRNVCATPPKALPFEKPYFLTVGAVKERKNTLRIVQAFAVCKKRLSLPHKLIIVGKTGNNYSQLVMDEIRKENLQGDIVFYGHANDAELSYLYKHTEALVFPSTIESFGFPVLEAMSCGTPVITSQSGGVAEVVGDGAALVDPFDVNDIARVMNTVATDTGYASTLVHKGYARTKLFSWGKTARDFLSLIKTIAGS